MTGTHLTRKAQMPELPIKELDDKELLAALVRESDRLRVTVYQEMHAAFGSMTDDARWSHPFPLRWELQCRYLLIQAWEAFCTVLDALAPRASGAALGAVRLLAEDVTLLLWLLEEEGERQRRACRLALTALRTIGSMVTHEPDAVTKAAVIERVETAEAVLRSIAAAEGVSTLKEVPDRPYLFRSYIPGSGYGMFALLSTLGGHPGFLQPVLFFRGSGTTVDINLAGAHGERAYWLALAYDLLRVASEKACQAMTWDRFRERVAECWVDVEPLVDEAANRWHARWGTEPAS